MDKLKKPIQKISREKLQIDFHDPETDEIIKTLKFTNLDDFFDYVYRSTSMESIRCQKGKK